jgi:hypothetical protein
LLKADLSWCLLFRRRDAPGYSHHVLSGERLADCPQPKAVGTRITIGERDDILARFGDAAIASMGKTGRPRAR